MKLNKNQIKSIVRDWEEGTPLRHYKKEKQQLISDLKDYINDLVEVNNKINKIEEKALNFVSESENESESVSESESESESNNKNEIKVHRLDKDQFKIIEKLKPGDIFKGYKYMGPYNAVSEQSKITNHLETINECL